jgi:carboxymethylenebutenolidase
MTAATVELLGSDASVPATIVAPTNPPWGAIIVVQEAFGVDDHIVDVCQRFAAAGCLAIAPQLFHRDGVNALPHDIERVQPHLARLSVTGIDADIVAAREYLAVQGFSAGATGIVGFCMGGSVALFEAAEHRFGAAVTFYGGGLATGRFGFPPLIDVAPRLQSPWLGVFGDLDPSIPVDHVELLRSAAATAQVPTSIVRYAHAGHAFHCDARPDRYHEPSAKDAWTKTIDWFARYLEPAA